jgi:hypothetical protein
MKRIFKNWFQPVGWIFLTLPLLLLSIPVGNGLFSLIAGVLFLLNVLWLVVSMFVMLFQKKWRESFYMLLFLLSIVITIGLSLN